MASLTEFKNNKVEETNLNQSSLTLSLTVPATVASSSALVTPPVSPVSKPKRTYRKKKPARGNAQKRQLPDDFVPSESSVICGRGKECFEHEGNKRFREIISKSLHEYMDAPGKSEKSQLVSKTMDIIRKACPQGAFIKEEKGGVWFEVSERYAREKVGAWFRDCLHQHYKSSSKAKHARKMARRVSFNDLDPDELMNFPLDTVEFELPDLDFAFDTSHRRASVCSSAPSVTETAASSNDENQNDDSQSFFEIDDMDDIDDLSVIPFDSIDF